MIESGATKQQNFGIYEKTRQKEQPNNTEGRERGTIEASIKCTNQEKELDKSQDIHIDRRNVMQLLTDLNMTDNTYENNDVYTSTASYSVAQVLNQTLSEGFTNHEKKLDQNNKELQTATDLYMVQSTKSSKNLEHQNV